MVGSQGKIHLWMMTGGTPMTQETTIDSTYVAILMGNSMIDPRFIMGNATMNGISHDF